MGGCILRPIKTLAACGLLALAVATTPALGQGKSKHYVVTSDRALIVTREVLVKQGFEVVEVRRAGPDQVVYYRSGNRGKGKGKGKLEKMVIRHETNHVIFVDTPATILGAIDIRLRL